jgi:hypothetical protein
MASERSLTNIDEEKQAINDRIAELEAWTT